MQLEDIVSFWGRQRQDTRRRWMVPEDAEIFDSHPHSFNLDFPLSPFVGDVLHAPIIVLGACGGYDPVATPGEFSDEDAAARCVERVRHPSGQDWANAFEHYTRLNYGPLLFSGEAVLINACGYRTRKISEEKQNQRVLDALPSTAFNRQWLDEAVLPLAEAGERLVVAKRHGYWKLPPRARQSPGFVFDPAPVSPHITGEAWTAVQRILPHPL